MLSSTIFLLIIFLISLAFVFTLIYYEYYTASKIILFLFIIESFVNLLIFQGKINWIISIFSIFAFISILIYTSKKDITYSFRHPNQNGLKTIIEDLGLDEYKIHLGFLLFSLSFLLEIVVFDGQGFFTNQGVSSPLLVISLVSLCWISFDFIPKKYYYERDFIFLFFNFLLVLYVLPLVTLKISTQSVGEARINPFQDFTVSTFLAKPLVIMLSATGYTVWSQGISIFYIDTTTNLSTAVIVSSGCSGLYSVLIFLCAYLSYTTLLYNVNIIDKISFMFFGLLIAYFANLFRMFFVVLAGHYGGNEWLDLVHANGGWLIFTLWIYIFWSILSKVFPMFDDTYFSD